MCDKMLNETRKTYNEIISYDINYLNKYISELNALIKDGFNENSKTFETIIKIKYYMSLIELCAKHSKNDCQTFESTFCVSNKYDL